MTKNFGIALAVGLGIVAIIVTSVLYMQRGARVGLSGQILKIRTAPMDETNSIMVADFRVKNPSYVVFEVRSVKVFLETADGNQFEGMVIAEQDAKRLFDAVPILGQKFNETLRLRDTVPAGATLDRMVAAHYAAPVAKIETRKRFLIRIEDVDGATVELSEK